MPTVKKLSKSKLFILLEIGVFLLGSYFLFNLNYTFNSVRAFLYLLAALYICCISIASGIDINQLGITSKSIVASLRALLPTIASIVVLIVITRIIAPETFKFGLLTFVPTMPLYLKVLLYSLISVPLQELIFRGYFISRLENLSLNPIFLVVLSALAFALDHLLFGNIFMIVGTFIFGLVLANNFLKYRNLLSVVIAHGLIGSLLIYLVK